jgi:predicted DNA binding CopG/RHH family protein
MPDQPSFERDNTKDRANRAKHGISFRAGAGRVLRTAPRERRSMSNGTAKYAKGEIGRVRVVDDFLPAPEQLVPREDSVKVTLSLSRRSLDFFKREAKKQRVPYQRMIRSRVDLYAERQEGKNRRAG